MSLKDESVENTKKPKVMVVLPVLNEEKRIDKLVAGIVKQRSYVDMALVVIDDGTVDNTRQEAENAGAIVLHNGAIRGVGAAIRRGIEYGLEKGMEICVIMAGDSQDPPQEIPKVLHPIIHEGFGFTQGSRYLGGQRTINMPLSRAILTRVYTLGFRLVTGFPATDASNGFRAFKLKRGYKIKEVPVTKAFDKKNGYSHMNVWKDNSFWAVIKGRLE